MNKGGVSPPPILLNLQEVQDYEISRVKRAAGKG